jgi:hypothetical protein
MTPETRAKKDRCTLVVTTDAGKLRILGGVRPPLIILEGHVCELREAGGQVHVPGTPTPPHPHEVDRR